LNVIFANYFFCHDALIKLGILKNGHILLPRVISLILDM